MAPVTDVLFLLELPALSLQSQLRFSIKNEAALFRVADVIKELLRELACELGNELSEQHLDGQQAIVERLRAEAAQRLAAWQAQLQAAESLRQKGERAVEALKTMREAYFKELCALREQVFQKNRANAGGEDFEPHWVVHFDPTDFTADEELQRLVADKVGLVQQQFEVEASRLRERVQSLSDQLRTAKLHLDRKDKWLQQQETGREEPKQEDEANDKAAQGTPVPVQSLDHLISWDALEDMLQVDSKGADVASTDGSSENANAPGATRSPAGRKPVAGRARTSLGRSANSRASSRDRPAAVLKHVAVGPCGNEVTLLRVHLRSADCQTALRGDDVQKAAELLAERKWAALRNRRGKVPGEQHLDDTASEQSDSGDSTSSRGSAASSGEDEEPMTRQETCSDPVVVQKQASTETPRRGLAANRGYPVHPTKGRPRGIVVVSVGTQVDDSLAMPQLSIADGANLPSGVTGILVVQKPAGTSKSVEDILLSHGVLTKPPDPSAVRAESPRPQEGSAKRLSGPVRHGRRLLTGSTPHAVGVGGTPSRPGTEEDLCALLGTTTAVARSQDLCALLGTTTAVARSQELPRQGKPTGAAVGKAATLDELPTARAGPPQSRTSLQLPSIKTLGVFDEASNGNEPKRSASMNRAVVTSAPDRQVAARKDRRPSFAAAAALKGLQVSTGTTGAAEDLGDVAFRISSGAGTATFRDTSPLPAPEAPPSPTPSMIARRRGSAS